MSRLNVNPTRMELKKLKARLKTATRGHKLLKDKSDEMIRRFTVLLKQNKKLRDEVEQALGDALKEFAFAKSKLSSYALENAFMMPTSSLQIQASTTSIMMKRSTPQLLPQRFPKNTTLIVDMNQTSGMTDKQGLDNVNPSEDMLIQLARMISARKTSVCDCQPIYC